MDSNHYQKIQNLVKAAAILSPAEKTEWLELMEMMSDRQLLELEKILGTADQRGLTATRKNAEQSAFDRKISRPELPTQNLTELPAPARIPKPPAVPMPAVLRKPAAAVQPQPGALSDKAIPFSHILNLPKASGPATNLAPKVESREATAPKKESAFLKKLKSIFAEKELPPGVLPEIAPPQAHPPAAASHSLHKKAPVPPAVLKKKEISKPEVKQPPHHKPAKDEGKEKENVTINLILQSPQDLAKFPGLAKAEKALEGAFERPVTGPVQLQREVSSVPKAAPAEAQAPAPAPPPQILQVIAPQAQTTAPARVISPARIIAESRPLPAGQIAGSHAAAKSAGFAPTINFVNNPPSDLVIQTGKVTIGPSISGPQEISPVSQAGLSERDIQALAAKQAQIQAKRNQENENVTPGLNFFESPTMGSSAPKPVAASGRLAGEPMIKTAKIILSEKPGDDIKLETLQDAANLQVDDLRQHAGMTFFKKLQKLAFQKGQDEVIFNLEKSPLYQAYVNTGTALLKNQSSFEKKSGLKGDMQLAREDFENFADLLIVMRSGA